MTHLEPGKKAPAFTGVDQNGNKVSLKDFKGKKVIVYFYPKDNTPSCTTQACNLRDNYNNLVKNDFEVIGISMDDVKSHSKFSDKYTLPFILIADVTKRIIEKYGVWGEKKFMGKTYMGIIRTTFLIDETGTISKILLKPDTKNHSKQILDNWK